MPRGGCRGPSLAALRRGHVWLAGQMLSMVCHVTGLPNPARPEGVPTSALMRDVLGLDAGVQKAECSFAGLQQARGRAGRW